MSSLPDRVPGVLLLSLEEERGQELFALVERNRSWLRQWLPWLDRTKSLEDSLTYLRAVRKRVLLYGEAHEGIHYHGRLVGVIGTHAIDMANRRTSLGYWIEEQSRGRGIVSEAVRQMLDRLFGTGNMHRVQIQCGEHNRASRAVPERLGFREEGLLRQNEWLYDHWVDHVVYAMLKPEWEELNRS